MTKLRREKAQDSHCIMKRSRYKRKPKHRTVLREHDEFTLDSTIGNALPHPEMRVSVSETETRTIPQRCFDFQAITDKLGNHTHPRHRQKGLPLLKPFSSDDDSFSLNSPEKRDHSYSDTDTDSIQHVTSQFEQFARAPLFANWKIADVTPTKVILSHLSKMGTTVEVSPDIVQFVKERDAAREEMKKAQDELTVTQSKLYDALQKVESLEKKAKEANSTKPKNKKPEAKKPTKKPATENGGLKPSAANTVRSSSSLSTRIDGTYHPPVDGIDPGSDSYEYYWNVAKRLPDLPMFKLMDAERKFIKADADNSGYIDRDELDKVLTETITMFTPKQIDEIFNEIDQDKSNTVDFYEVLVILDKLTARRRTNLPQSVTQNYSKTCSIQ